MLTVRYLRTDPEATLWGALVANRRLAIALAIWGAALMLVSVASPGAPMLNSELALLGVPDDDAAPGCEADTNLDCPSAQPSTPRTEMPSSR